jgi:hypothetical protein
MRSVALANMVAALAVGFVSSSAATTSALPRSTVDRPDDRPGAQIHVLYVLPSDGPDAALDTDGTVSASVQNFQTWLKGQTSGNGMRLDTAGGELDVSFVRLTETDAQLAGQGLFMRDAIERGTRAAGFNDPDKTYAAYYGGSNTAACGGGAWPPALPGKLAALYLRATYGAGLPCYDPSRSRTALQLMDLAMLHETLHALGFVPTCALNHTRSGHVSDSPNDLMYAGDQPWTPKELDVGRNDYFGANRPGCLDLSQSEYYEGGPAPTLPPSIVKRRLKVSVRGPGKVTSAPRGIACPRRCSATYPDEARVRLRPKARKGARFKRWSGACRGTRGCVVRMNRARAVRAGFVQKR